LVLFFIKEHLSSMLAVSRPGHSHFPTVSYGKIIHASRSGKLRILLIDDASGYRAVFARLLAESDIVEAQLEYVDNAADAARELLRGAHDIYFVDDHNPCTCETGLIEAARAAGIDRPIFCLINQGESLLDREAGQAGASLQLSKAGLTPSKLGHVIRFALRDFAIRSMPRDAEERLRLAQEAASIGTWDWHLASQIILWDSRMYQLFGRAPGQAAAARDVWQNALRPDAFAAITHLVHSCIDRNAPFQTDFEVTWEDGSVHFMRAAGRAIEMADGHPVRAGGICWEITEIRQLVAELAQARNADERANKAKSRFLAGMSHELRTPLNAILGHARLLRAEGGLNHTQRGRVEKMLDAGSHLLELIHCVLDLSEIETERVTLHAEPVDIRALCAACLDMIRMQAEEKGLSVCLDVAEDVPRHLLADAMRLRQILLNLCGNATKFTSFGGITLRVSRFSHGACLRLEMADTGPGIPAEKRHRLFQDFGRLHTDDRRAAEGAGLGLALSARLATLMGGRLDHIDNPGGGSVFFLEMPLIVAGQANQAETGAPQDAPKPPPPARPLQVLLVDDSEINLDIAASFIRLAGHAVACVGGGAEAVAAVAAQNFDIVLMDVQMPDIDGLEATRRIRALPGPPGQVPVVALTAQVFTEQLDACAQAGMTGHLAKPFTESALFAILSAIDPLPHADRPRDAEPVPSKHEPLPIIDLHLYATNTRLLRPASIHRYLENIQADAAAVLVALRGWAPPAEFAEDHLKAAHKLAGNAGLFGFTRAADTARRFERAARAGAPDRFDLSQRLITALDATLQEADRRLNAAGP